VIRAVLDSGWTVTGVTLAWLLLIAGLSLRAGQRTPASPRSARLWDEG
jgi:hypothetical protein